MFRTDDSINLIEMRAQLEDAAANYVVQPNDLLSVQVFTNGGELLIDPNAQLRREIGGFGQNGQGMNQNFGFGGLGGLGGMNQNNRNGQAGMQGYLVEPDGSVMLPMIGAVTLAGLTQPQMDSLLSAAYSVYYEKPFVMSRVVNRRVFVLGGIRSGGQMFILQNENTTVIEVLATLGGLERLADASNLRLIRGDLQDPIVQIIDLSTIQGMRAAELRMLPNDILYVEPGRRPFFDVLRDTSTLIGFFGTLVNLSLTIFLLTQPRD